jgi:hypothetical protein
VEGNRVVEAGERERTAAVGSGPAAGDERKAQQEKTALKEDEGEGEEGEEVGACLGIGSAVVAVEPGSAREGRKKVGDQTPSSRHPSWRGASLAACSLLRSLQKAPLTAEEVTGRREGEPKAKE